MNNYCVYKHKTPDNKVYIGITKRGKIRWGRDGTGYKGNRYFYRAIQKYGWNNITHDILFSDMSKEDACKKEIELIKSYKSNDPAYGFNICAGGEGRLESYQSEKTRKKISTATTEQWKDPDIRKSRVEGLRGHEVSQVTREKIRKSQIGKYVPPEVGQKISKSKKGKHPWNYGKKCGPRSDETKAKLSAFNKGKIISQEQRDKISKKLKGREITPEWRAKISETLKKRNAERRCDNENI